MEINLWWGSHPDMKSCIKGSEREKGWEPLLLVLPTFHSVLSHAASPFPGISYNNVIILHHFVSQSVLWCCNRRIPEARCLKSRNPHLVMAYHPQQKAEGRASTHWIKGEGSGDGQPLIRNPLPTNGYSCYTSLNSFQPPLKCSTSQHSCLENRVSNTHPCINHSNYSAIRCHPWKVIKYNLLKMNLFKDLWEWSTGQSKDINPNCLMPVGAH